MDRPGHASSVFSQSLDRALFLVYFLGAVVPLLALGWFVQRHVLPDAEDGFAAAAVVGVVVGIAVLSLASFFVLRRLARGALVRTNADNRRLAGLLDVSRTLALAPHRGEVVETAARCACEMTDADGALVVERAKPDEPLAVLAAAGPQARRAWEELEGELHDAVEWTAAEQRPLVSGAGAGGDGVLDPDGFSAALLPLGGRGSESATLVALRTGGRRAFGPAEVDALSTLAGLASVALRNADLQDAQRNFFSHVTDVLVTALDAHLDQQGGHCHRVAEHANHIGRELGLDEHRLERLHFAALLHDIGMLKLDRARHRSRQTAEPHPVLGHRMLARIRLWEDIAPFVLHHHEWFDGSGYPGGLAGEAIPLESRIIAVADAFDAMTSHTGYKAARSVDEALRELRDCAGSQFDPRIVEAWTRRVGQGAGGAVSGA